MISISRIKLLEYQSCDMECGGSPYFSCAILISQWLHDPWIYHHHHYHLCFWLYLLVSQPCREADIVFISVCVCVFVCLWKKL